MSDIRLKTKIEILKTAIRTDNLSRVYKKGGEEVAALSGFSVDIPKGSFVSIVGKSGSGKSTFLNLTGGLDRPTSGNIIIGDADLSKMSRKQLAIHRKFSIGMIFQSFNLIPTYSAKENVALALAFGGVTKKERKQKAVELLDKVGLKDRVNHKPTELSGGESQRVAIARAIANNPEIILADEPTGNLDSETSQQVIGILKHLNKEEGKTVIMVTHDLETAELVSDFIIRLKDGKQITT